MEIKEFKYSANFCEENIWHLCKNPALVDFSKKVLIVSNSKRYCPFRFQKSIHCYEVVWWNYHVILLASLGDCSLIYDFDTTLPVPLPANDYMRLTFGQSESWAKEDQPCFKAVDSRDYLRSFVSDRSHMRDAFGNWLATPPDWNAIGNNGDLPLPELVDFSLASGEQIYSLEEMMALVGALSGAS